MKIHINNDDNYATPPELYNSLNKRFKFDFDPCPYNEGEIMVDGLNVEWGTSNFINPPYSQKLKEKFVIKGIEEMKKGKLCVFLIPVSTSTKLFHDYIKPNATAIEFIKGRVQFGKLDERGIFYYPLNKHQKKQSGTKDSMIVIFDGRILKTSDEWLKNTNHTILDPDGWDRTNYQYSFYEELITESEFYSRLYRSTLKLDITEHIKHFEL